MENNYMKAIIWIAPPLLLQQQQQQYLSHNIHDAITQVTYP